MKPKLYLVTFLKRETDSSGKTKLRRVGDVTLDDNGTSQQFPLIAKAFRHAPPGCAHADKVRIERL